MVLGFISFENFLNLKFMGNTIEQYLLSFLIMLAGIIASRFVRSVIIKRFFTKNENRTEVLYNFIKLILRKYVLPFIYVLSFYLAIQGLTLSKDLSGVIKSILLIVSIWFVIQLSLSILKFIINKYAERIYGEGNAKISPLISLINFLVYIVGALFLLDNLGFQISSVIAGLGLGGVAIALAAQGFLGDLFGYFIIFFDKPFQVGDFITFDDKLGVIEKIGVKSSRLRSPNGELLIISNSNLVNARIHNMKEMVKRRSLFSLGVTYQTTSEQLRKIPELIKTIIENEPNTEFERVHFRTYGDFALIFEVSYFVSPPDFIPFLEIQQRINLQIFESFKKENIEFAYPTQTLFMNKDEN
ncbi:MAG: mechanosensitive ion channel family protein [Ignavibacteriales bacterium]|nr:mechanosensitive ion channel family protein [Ignavibacteriales bacterium]MCF8306215.1 mechanosensitive ion channel family protein [Ignavibacteriales bacterium]MCF8315936.1 mechanosensitive ion channel family protein [Ignavibacteriales bacterium]MCF8437530.1 mechanosensitive ion channel family protein [Ignavibacteriales bacterium]